MTKREMFEEGISEQTGKMKDFMSFSTSNVLNTHCQKFKESEMVCRSCFADRMTKRYVGLRAKLARNEFIKEELITKQDVPFINASYFRFESFGELQNMTQLLNYFTIAKGNSQTMFTLWTKRVDLLRALEVKKPSNFRIILSSYKLNEQMPVPTDIKHLVNGIFTVYNKKGSEGVNINCGDKRCKDCLLCYKKSRTFRVINERLK